MSTPVIWRFSETRKIGCRSEATESTPPVVQRTFGASMAASQDNLKKDIEEAFGVIPNFFSVADHVPELQHFLFQFARTAYLDSPLPALFKERLFAYLSRFCEADYCVARHVAFLVGTGNVAGDPVCPAMHLPEVLDMLREPPPDNGALIRHYSQLRDLGANCDWPKSAEAEEHIFACAVAIFTRTGGKTPVVELRRVLSAEVFEQLVLLTSFIRFAHDWTENHPGVRHDPDVETLLSRHLSLSSWLATYRDVVADELENQADAERLRLRSMQDRLQRELDTFTTLPNTATSTINPREVLSERELQTFILIGHGQSTKQIATRMQLSTKTVETYRTRLKNKLEIKTMPELAMEATAWVMRNPEVS